jgi:hypothetical protein
MAEFGNKFMISFFRLENFIIIGLLASILVASDKARKKTRKFTSKHCYFSLANQNVVERENDSDCFWFDSSDYIFFLP